MNCQAGSTDIKMENWRAMVPDPRHTCGQVTQLKKTLYLYWNMKSLLGKALEYISISVETEVQEFHSYKQDFQKIQFQLQKQDGRLRDTVSFTEWPQVKPGQTHIT